MFLMKLNFVVLLHFLLIHLNNAIFSSNNITTSFLKVYKYTRLKDFTLSNNEIKAKAWLKYISMIENGSKTPQKLFRNYGFLEQFNDDKLIDIKEADEVFLY